MSISVETLDKFVQKVRKSDSMDRTIIDRIFEQIPHNYPELEDINYCMSSGLESIKKANIIADKLPEDLHCVDFYLTATPSFFYNILLSSVKIPTLGDYSEDEMVLHLCFLELDDDHSAYKISSYYMANMNLPENKIVLLCDDAFKLIETKLLAIKISDHKSFSVKYKHSVLEKPVSELSVLSINQQQKNKICVTSILGYKSSNSKNSTDNSRLDNLQFYLIEQQVRNSLFLVLLPLFENCFIRVNRLKSIIEPSGNLPVKIMLTKPVEGEPSLTIHECFQYLIDFGLMISSSDLDGRVKFSCDTSQDFPPSINLESTNSHVNSSYALMFRLFDLSLVENLDQIEKMINDHDFDAVYNLLENLFNKY